MTYSSFIKVGRFICMAALIFLITACASVEETSPEPADTNSEKEAKELQDAKLVTNWFAQPEHGGNYTALEKRFYEEVGINMTIEPGGPQVSSTQIVASGQAQFGYTQAEDLLLARDQGIPLVAIGSIFQKSPQVLVSHEGILKEFKDLEGKTVYTKPGSGYWEYIKKAYDLKNVNEMAYTGSLANFMNDPNAVTQGYATSEPFVIDQQGVKNDYLFIHDSGFETYANVIFTTEDIIENNPDLVKAFMEATTKGWEYYNEHSDEMNPVLQEANPDLTLELMAYGAEAQRDLIFGGGAAEHGFGYMTKERWSKIQSALLDLGIIQNEEDIEKVFTLEFIGE